MKSSSTSIAHQTAKAVLITTVALSLLLPSGLAAADTITQSSGSSASISADAPALASKADSTKVKFSKEKAIAKLKELFPSLNDATVDNVQLGSNSIYPPPLNQMVWHIQWNYQVGNSTHGFSSEVDAINGDIISAYTSFRAQGNETYYPPKLSRAQALEKAQGFITKAASSIKLSDLKLEEEELYNSANSALFGPVQYGFSFRTLRNGIASSFEYVNVIIDGNGNVVQFNKPNEGFEYPVVQPKLSREQADKKISDSFDVGLYYVPVYKNGAFSNWVLAWRPVEQAMFPIDALTGKRIDQEGKESSVTSVTYKEVPQSKVYFQPRSTGTELTAEEAAKLVEQTGYIPAKRKLNNSYLGDSYLAQNQKSWRLTWSEGSRYFGGGMPTQSSAVVDAKTGEIYQFQSEEYSDVLAEKVQPPAPAGGKKLTPGEAKEKALGLINRLYDQASTRLKLVEQGEDWNVLADGAGYRYQFDLYYKGIPVSDSAATITLDIYGRLLSYTAMRNTEINKISQEPVPVITKQEALDQFRKMYTVKLQYNRVGGYTNKDTYTTPTIKLVYVLSTDKPSNAFVVLDALTGKEVNLYNVSSGEQGAAATDLKGNGAEKELSELLKYNVITPDADGKVNPDQEITAGEWFTMLAKASSPYYSSYYGATERKKLAGVNPESPYYDAVGFAVERQWIGKDTLLQIDTPLTREQLAVYLTSFIKYSKISAFLDQDAAVSQFSDNASITNKGAVAVAVKLGLLQGHEGKFNPQQTVTRAAAASVIMKLVELQGKTDQAIAQ